MGRNSKMKDLKKASKTSAYKSSQALRKSLPRRRRPMRGKHEENLSICSSSVEKYLGTVNSCYTLLNDMCVQATLFQRHSHRDKLLASDISKASSLYLLEKQSNIIHEKVNNIELSSCVEKTFDIKEAEKTLFYGKCLHCPELTDIKIDDIDQCLMDYFETAKKAIFVDNSEFFSMLVSDLKKNLSILPILPVFIHNLCNDDMLSKNKPVHLKKLLIVVHSLYLNPNLYFPNEYLHTILDFIISCAITNYNSKNYPLSDVFSLQDTSAEILQDIFVKNQSLSLQVNNYILTKLALPYQETKVELISWCGSLTIVNTMGLSACAFILPLIFYDSSSKGKAFLNILTEDIESNGISYAKVVQNKLFEACQILVKFSLYKTAALPDFREMYKVVHSNHDKLSKSKTNAPPLDGKLCCLILKYYGKRMISSLPILLNASNKIVPITDIFEKLQQNSLDKIEV